MTTHAMLAALVLSAFGVRLRGHYLAIASMGFAVITYQILLNWISVTQGPLGIYAIKPPPPLALPGLAAIDFAKPANMFYLVAGFTFAAYLVLSALVRSSIGEALTAVREDEISAASLGINCAAWKVFAFGVGAAYAGAAGCFYASFVGTLVPDAFNMSESFTILAMVIVGGMGTLIGPVWGAILLTLLPELLRSIGDLRLIIYGLALTLVVMIMPGGLVQLARGVGSDQPSQEGAMHALARQSFGTVLLSVVAAGLAAYTMLRAAQAIMGRTPEAGRHRRASSPPPSRFDRAKVPPSAAASCCAMARPSPVPPVSRLRELSIR